MPGAVQLSQVVTLSDVLVDNHFSFWISAIPGGDSDAFYIRNMTASLPGDENAVTKVTLHRHDVNYANRRKFTQRFTATYIDTEDRKILTGLKLWRAAVTDPITGLPAAKAAYARIAQVAIYGSYGTTVESREYVNIWPSKVNDVPLNGSSENAPLTFSVEFTYDMWVPL